MMINKIPLSGFGVEDLCVISDGDPPLDFARDLGLSPPAPAPVQTAQSVNLDTTYWQYQGWQPS